MGTELVAPRQYVECQEKAAKDNQRQPKTPKEHPIFYWWTEKEKSSNETDEEQPE